MPKISALPVGSNPTGAELIPAVQGGVTYKFTFAQIAIGGLRQVVTASSGVVADTTSHLIVNRSAPSTTALTLPNLSTWLCPRLAIVDYSQSVTDHTITLTPYQASQKIMRQSTWPLYSNAASLVSLSLERIVDPDDATNYVWIIAP
jgi:hypothetical protein